MGVLDRRVAIITGAGRGLGRDHALLFAAEGAKVVVNDLGGAPDGGGSDQTAAEQVVAEVKAMGGDVIHTSSTSGLLGNPGQTNYGAAKAGIGSFSIICAKELGRYGVRSNCIAPAARTRLTESTPGLGEIVKPPDDAETFDVWDPANVSPL